MNDRKEIVLATLERFLGAGQNDLAEQIEAIIQEYPDFNHDPQQREALRKGIQLKMRPLTNDLRALIHCPDQILAAIDDTTVPEIELHKVSPPTHAQARFDQIEL